MADGTVVEADLALQLPHMGATHPSTPEKTSESSSRLRRRLSNNRQSLNVNALTEETVPFDHRAASVMAVPGSVKRSTVRALKGILKKPRRFSKDIETPPLEDPKLSDEAGLEPGGIGEGMVGQITDTHSDDDDAGDQRNNDISVSDTEQTAQMADSSVHATSRSTFQLQEFDRMLFAIRGAQLRNEYLRDNRRQVETV